MASTPSCTERRICLKFAGGMISSVFILLLIAILSSNPRMLLFGDCKSEATVLDSMVHDVAILTPQNFESQITRKRGSQVNAVVFHTRDANAKKLLHGEINKLAGELKGMVTVGAVDCDQFPMLCEDQNAASGHPVVTIYPILPFPAYKYEGDVSVASLKKALFRLIPTRNLDILTPDNVNKFLTQTISVPKVVFFSSKPMPAVLFKAVSNAFETKLHFGYIDGSNPSNDVLLSRWSVTSSQLPRIMLLKHDSKLPQFFKGKDIIFSKLFEWLNVFAETFVLGGGFTDQVDSNTSKPWLAERMPELTALSQHDICFSKSEKSKGLCVIYLKYGASLLPTETSMLEQLSEQFTSHLTGRGATFRWMWMDLSAEKGFFDLFEISESSLPSVVVFNPHKRLRFTSLSENTPANANNIKQLLDKIAGGDARFKNVKGQTLPAFIERAVEEKKKVDDEKKREEL
eukprot:GHVS01089559.1.p1 GENE.GHVS01089559.1~~GHVS01089559.1.p1  ORF type:complete len:459 (+),score=70.63 GHVS01089559.1:106-1482(+)